MKNKAFYPYAPRYGNRERSTEASVAKQNKTLFEQFYPIKMGY